MMLPATTLSLAKFFYPEPFADAVAAVLDAALSFFVSHEER